jgi:uncharacterized protein (DUF433 family)
MTQLARKRLCAPTHRFPPRSYRDEWDFSDRPPLLDRDLGYKDFDIPISDVFYRSLQGRPSIAIDYNILDGTPHITGTRVPVFMVLDAIEFYGNLDGALKSYPNLTLEQVKDAVSFAAAVTEHPVDYKIESPAG